MNFFIVCVVGCLMLQTRTMHAAEPVPPGEFGKATFLRDYPTALAKAKADKNHCSYFSTKSQAARPAGTLAAARCPTRSS